MFNLTVKGSEERVLLANITALRVAFVIASVMILAGVVLSQMVHIAFIALPVLVSLGLLFSAVVGWCPLALLVEHLLVRPQK